MRRDTMHTMSDTRNPVIRVTPEARKILKIIAAETGKTMQEVVEQLARQEHARLKKLAAKKGDTE
jgi:DNA-binding MarR family transcriptional regulator